jgi:hypothetical protein
VNYYIPFMMLAGQQGPQQGAGAQPLQPKQGAGADEAMQLDADNAPGAKQEGSVKQEQHAAKGGEGDDAMDTKEGQPGGQGGEGGAAAAGGGGHQHGTSEGEQSIERSLAGELLQVSVAAVVLCGKIT